MTQLISTLLISGIYISALGRSLVSAKYYVVTIGEGEMPPAFEIYVKYPLGFLWGWLGEFASQYVEGIRYSLSPELVDVRVEIELSTDEAILKAEKESEDGDV